MSKKVHMLARVIAAGNGGQMVVPIKVYDDAAQAREAALERGEAIKSLLSARLVHLAANGKGGVDTGMTLQQFLSDFGIVGFDHAVMSTDVESALWTPPGQSGLIIPH